jgi:hypothetical protein
MKKIWSNLLSDGGKVIAYSGVGVAPKKRVDRAGEVEMKARDGYATVVRVMMDNRTTISVTNGIDTNDMDLIAHCLKLSGSAVSAPFGTSKIGGREVVHCDEYFHLMNT